MRVANVIEEGKVGGPQVRMVRVAAALRGRVETLIIMPRANSQRFRGLCDAHDVSFRVLPLTRITKNLGAAVAYLLFSPIEIVRLARVLKHEHIDLVHASGGCWQYKGVIAARLAGIPVVWHLNDTSMPKWVRFLFQLMQPLAAGLIFASERSKEYYGDRIGGERPQVIVPAAVDAAAFDTARRYPGDPDFAIPDAGHVIGTVANANPVKGLETLIRGAAWLRDRGDEPHVLIVGPVFDRQRGYYRQLLTLVEELGLNRMHFVGARSDVRPLLAKLDVYVCSSVAESSPVSVWEAMAMARPVVSTDVGDVPQYVINGESGFVVPVGAHEALGRSIARLLEDKSLRRRCGERARSAAIENFSVDRVAKATGDFYERVLKCRHGRQANGARPER